MIWRFQLKKNSRNIDLLTVIFRGVLLSLQAEVRIIHITGKDCFRPHRFKSSFLNKFIYVLYLRIYEYNRVRPITVAAQFKRAQTCTSLTRESGSASLTREPGSD
jgi:hypothetical protein